MIVLCCGRSIHDVVPSISSVALSQLWLPLPIAACHPTSRPSSHVPRSRRSQRAFRPTKRNWCTLWFTVLYANKFGVICQIRQFPAGFIRMTNTSREFYRRLSLGRRRETGGQFCSDSEYIRRRRPRRRAGHSRPRKPPRRPPRCLERRHARARARDTRRCSARRSRTTGTTSVQLNISNCVHRPGSE